MNTKKTTFITGVVAISLTGCFSDEASLYSICEDNPQICSDIEAKGWCKEERSTLIRNRHRQITHPKDELNQYNSLMNWKTFSQCIETASNIKRRNIEDRDPTKAASFVNSVKAIDELEQQTVNSDLPQLLYYHWSQNGDASKIDKLIELDAQSQLQTTQLQLMMASYYGKVNKRKAAQAQYEALSLLTQNDIEALDHSVFASLSTYYFQENKLKLSYIWARVAVKFGLKANLYSSLTAKLERNGVNLQQLNLTAEKTYQSIITLNFMPPKIALK